MTEINTIWLWLSVDTNGDRMLDALELEALFYNEVCYDMYKTSVCYLLSQ